MTDFRTSAIAAILCVLISTPLWAKDPIPTPKDTTMMGQLDPYLLKFFYPSSDPDGSLADIVAKDSWWGFKDEREAVFSYNKGNFFGMLKFDLTKSDPEMTFLCVTIGGKIVYSLTLKRSQLQSN